MRHFHLPSILVALLACSVSGCFLMDPDLFQEYELSLNPSVIAFTAAGGSQDITVETDAPSWTAAPSDSWIRLSTSGNVITVTVEANTGEDGRQGTVTFSAGMTKT